MAPLQTIAASGFGDGVFGRLAQRSPAPINPTRTLVEMASRVVARQQPTTTVVTTNTGTTGKTRTPGQIAGIVIGSVVGFLLLLWIIRSCANMSKPAQWGSTFEPEREREKPASYGYPSSHRHRSHSRHSHRSPRRSSVVRPIIVEQRGRSPRAPPAVYQTRRDYDGRDLRRAGGSRRSRY